MVQLFQQVSFLGLALEHLIAAMSFKEVVEVSSDEEGHLNLAP